MKNLLVLFFTFFIFTGVFAQSNSFKALGDKAFKDANYYQAAYYYKMAADKRNNKGSVPFYSGGKVTKEEIKTENLYINYRLAESYRLYQNYRDAADWYYKILNENIYPLARLWYGQCLRAEARFDEALKELQQFKTGYKGSKEFIDVADREIASCLFAKQQYALHKQLKVTKMQAPWNAEAGDYALTKNGGNYWFTSSRLVQNNKTHLNNIFTASTQNSLTPVLINFSRDSVNKGDEYGTPSITPSGKKLYLTSWYKKGNKTILAIYSSEMQNNTWSALRKLNSNVNAEGFNALQPFVAEDGRRLFFVSDRPGGQGGYDIWMSDLDGNGNPVNSVNLGKTINTPFDEEAPFYDSLHKRLVFSSKGFTGLGGFDFFESYESNGTWSTPTNLGYPMNSSRDDLYYYEDPDDNSKFYFSSDRESDCCLNLFEVHYLPIAISGKIVDCDSNKTLNNVNVSLSDSASGKIMKQVVTSANGNYNFEVLKNSSFKLTVEKTGYFKKNIPISARMDTLSIPDICLTPFKVNKPIVIKNIFYDFGSSDLRPESKIALDNVYKIMQDNPNIKIELRSHTDSIGSDAYNLNLSQQRARACVDYIISKGINSDKIVAKGYGKNMPIAPNSFPDGKDNPEGRQLNRRTEFVVKSQ